MSDERRQANQAELNLIIAEQAAEIERLRDLASDAANYIAELHRDGHGLENGWIMMSQLRAGMGEERWNQGIIRTENNSEP